MPRRSISQYVTALVGVANALNGTGELDEARELARRAVNEAQHADGANGRHLDVALVALSNIDANLGDRRAALEGLRRALGLVSARGQDETDTAASYLRPGMLKE